jgi:hypothetical protein
MFDWTAAVDLEMINDSFEVSFFEINHLIISSDY